MVSCAVELPKAPSNISVVLRLSSVVFPGSAIERNMAMYSAYFDESTGNGSPVLVVAGFLSTDAQWGLFESEWKDVLSEFGIRAFHAQHFSKHKGEFLGWDEPKRQALMGKLLAIINRRVKIGFASVVHVGAFKEVFVGADRRSIGSPYNLCCTVCHLQVGEWAKANYQIEPIAYFFDAGHPRAAEAAKTFLETKKQPENAVYRMGAIAFEDDEILVPLQAADLAAYEVWKWLDEHFAQKQRHGRFPLQEIIKIPWTIREFDKSILEEMLEHRKTGKAQKRIIHSFVPALRPGETAPKP